MVVTHKCMKVSTAENRFSDNILRNDALFFKNEPVVEQ